MSLSYEQLSDKLDQELGFANGLRDDNNLLHDLLDERDEEIARLKQIIKRRGLN